MKKVFCLLFSVILSGILSGCASCPSAPAPGAPEQSVEEYVRRHWKAIATPHPVAFQRKLKLSPKESGKKFEEYKNIFQKHAPYLLEEYAAIDRGLNWQPGTALRLSFFGRDAQATLKQKKKAPRHECTSWSVLPDKAADNQLFLHKNRDTGIKKSVIVHRMHPGKYAYIGLCDIGLLDITMGMNSVGLAITMNSGDKSGIMSNPAGLDTTQIGRILLENCSTAAEAVSFLERLVREKAYNHSDSGSIWMIADRDCVYTVEHDAVNFACRKTVSGSVVRANTWALPEMLPYSRKSIKGVRNSRLRERAVLDVLFDQGRQSGRRVTAEIMARTARISQIPGEPGEYPPCANHTVSGATFSIDREFPADLSTVYAAAGNPDNTFFLPIPITADEIPAELLNQEHSRKVYKNMELKKKFVSDKKRAEIESLFHKNHGQTREEARKILRKDFSDAARIRVRQMMNTCFKKNCKIFQESFK